MKSAVRPGISRMSGALVLFAAAFSAQAQIFPPASGEVLDSARVAAASVIPADSTASVNWHDGSDKFVQAIAGSFYNFHLYYDETHRRYGVRTSEVDQVAMKAAWLLNLAKTSGYNKITANPPDHGWGWTITQPEIPLVNREVTTLNHKTGFSKPHLPPLRWTRDGRIGLVGDTGGLDGKPQPLRIHLNRPEILRKHFVDSSPGVHTVDLQAYEIADYKTWGLPGTKLAQFTAFCEAEPKRPEEANPYACGANGQDDCYKLTLLGSGVTEAFDTSAQVGLSGGIRTSILPQLAAGDRLFSREVTVRVSNPKTSVAKIAHVSVSENYKVAPIRQGVLFELMAPADGRLFVARRFALPLVWRHSVTGQMKTGNYDTVYSVAPENAAPCDVTQWGDLYPISHAPYDPRVKNKYLFARYPFRDPMGNYIPDGDDLKGTYPWIDKDAKVMTVMISGANLFGGYFSKARFSHACVHSGCTPRDRDATHDNTYAALGGWTKGKMVVMDNLLNFADFRIDLSNALYLDLYQPGSALAYTDNRSSRVEVGGTRTLSHSEPNSRVPVRDEYGNAVMGSDGKPALALVKNSSVFESPENRLNYNPHMKPVAPHDVVWSISSGSATDEFSFDDYLNDNAFIVSEMVAAFRGPGNDSLFRMTAFDGWNDFWADFRGQVKVQNAATTLPDRWKVPDAGDVVHGRVEPVANGGVKGKGLYFNGQNTRILYDIPSAQPRAMNGSYWFHSLFLDARGLSANQERVVLNFPDKSRLTIRDAGTNVAFQAYNNFGELQRMFLVPSALVRERWFHLGVQTAPNGSITIFVNGYPYTEFTSANGSLFVMTSGALVLGRGHHDYDRRYASFWDMLLGNSTATPVSYGVFKGWMDEYKVFSYRPDPETVCNFANGTLVAAGTSTAMNNLAALYSAPMHARISTALQLRGQPTHSRYACYMNNVSKGRMAALHAIPDGAVGIRQNLHFPEGPIYHDAPRPDSSANEFCLACHSNNGAGGLSVAALKYRNTPAKLDPRRQPMQAPPFITGNLPAEFVDSFNGDWRAVGSAYIDEYVQPGSAGLAPEIRNLVLVSAGQPLGVLSNGATVTRSQFAALRVNASGLAARVVFQLNGVLITDAEAPFELAASRFATGGNQLSVTAYTSSGLQSQRSYSVTVR